MKWSERKSYNEIVTFVTVLFDGHWTGVPHTVGVYTAEWVDKLYRGIARNFNGPFDFVCLTDRHYDFKEEVRQVRFLQSVDQYGWMSMLEQYRPDICSSKRMTLGLDTVITGPLNDICSFDGKIALCTDPLNPHLECNAITVVNDKLCYELWERWVKHEKEIMHHCKLQFADGTRVPSEMVALRSFYKGCPRLDELNPNKILSYRLHLLPRPELLESSSIIYFHGNTKPHQIKETWLEEHWI